MALILIPLPSKDFDPTEVAVPWLTLSRQGHEVRFATPTGGRSSTDHRLIDGSGFGPWRSFLRADQRGRDAYAALERETAFRHPWSYAQAASQSLGGLLLPGGHASGMREYLESSLVQQTVVATFATGTPVGAICHGVVVAARSRYSNGKSVLFGRKTTALTRVLELTGWLMTPWLGNYYRTYPQTVQAEVTAALASSKDFVAGPSALLRDSPIKLSRGFTVRDGNYLSARWPGDAHRFAVDFGAMLTEHHNTRGTDDLGSAPAPAV